MKPSVNKLLMPKFSHIYIEERAFSYPDTENILSRFPQAAKIPIGHYKDIFSRHNQNYRLQKQSQNLILAVKEPPFLYPGALVCQDFGNHHFYYTSPVLNCLYDCEYCYLQGMYPSANLVVFVNTEDFFREIDTRLADHPLYLSISYDTDLLALEPLLGLCERWIQFTHERPLLTIEIRTKSAAFKSICHLPPSDRIILAWTLSPEPIAADYEHGTPPLKKRLKALKKAGELGWKLRLCFDPLIYVPNWQEYYQEAVAQTFQTLSKTTITDASIGVFRVSSGYLKKMRRQSPESLILHYPYESDQGVCHYGKDLSYEMTAFMKQQLKPYLSEKQLFLWSEHIKED